MKDRIKSIRKKLAMTADDFSSKLAVSRTTITNIETGARQPSNQLINSICREFDVNEHWLRTGEGQMFNELSREEELTRFFAKTLRNPESKTMRALIYTLAQLPDEALDAWADFAIRFCESLQKEKSGQPPDNC